MTTQIRKLQKELFETAHYSPDDRFKNWTKTIESIDKSKSDGWAFNGEYINDGDVEVEIKPTIFLVCTSQGSRRYPISYYEVIKMDEHGNLESTGIKTDSSSKGWALRIRDQVADLLDVTKGIDPLIPVEISNTHFVRLALFAKEAELSTKEAMEMLIDMFAQHS